MSLSDDLKGILKEYLEYKKKVFFARIIGCLLGEIFSLIIIYIKYLFYPLIALKYIFLITLITIVFIISEYIDYRSKILVEFFDCSKTII